MPDLAPFRALRFDPLAGRPGELLAPPYDVIDAGEAEALRGRSPFNCVRLVLPEGEAPERYRLAARRLADWKTDRVLEREASPSVYVYRQTFEAKGTLLHRRALFAALRLVPLDSGEVLPHERTHRGPKEDRLALTLACRAQLSPIFTIGEDPDGRLTEALDSVAEQTPVLDGPTPDGITHTLWCVSDESAATRLCTLASRGPLLIADGHHRYETALAAAAARPEEEGARRTLCCIVGERDPGLTVLPTHRALEGEPPGGSWIEALGSSFDMETLPGEDPDGTALRVAAEGGAILGLFAPAEGGAHLLRAKESAVAGTGIAPSQARVAAAIFDRIVLESLLDTSADAVARDGALTYHRGASEAASACGEKGAAFLLPPVDVDAVRDAVSHGERLPAKTTYFFPKIPTGLVFRPW